MTQHHLWKILSFIALLVLGVSRVGTAQSSNAATTFVGVKFEGTNRTDEEWLLSYLNLQFPTSLSEEQLRALETKILTTEVFTSAKLSAIETQNSESSTLLISVTEKWTAIPVVRGAFGGGTPFLVVGAYNTHSFGRLWTLGAEMQRYGTAPWGGVVWAKAPRFYKGDHELAFEGWRQFRVRSIYDDNGEKLGEFRADASMFRQLVMAPIKSNLVSHMKMGLDLRYRKESPTHFHPEEDTTTTPEGIRITDLPSSQLTPMVRHVFDNMSVDNLLLDGARTVVAAGPIVDGSQTKSRLEGEAFLFKWIPGSTFNLGAHIFAGQSTSDSLESQYFLGGFESVRGLPDGIIYGTRAFYTNLELRHISYKFPYTWLQTAIFSDLGGAGPNWHHVAYDLRASAGVGLRIAIPQIYRLMFRIDYAWSLDDPGVSGVSLGMNQFFQPYKPL